MHRALKSLAPIFALSFYIFHNFESENAPGATQGRTPLDFRLVKEMPAPPGQMVRDLAGWQAQQQDQNMMDEGSGTGTEPLNPGKTQPDEVWNQREQVWQQYIQKHPDVAQAEQSQVKTTIVEREESAGTEREESAGTEREESAGTPYLAPPRQNFPFDSIEELAEDMRHNCERYEHEIDYRLWDIGSSKSL